MLCYVQYVKTISAYTLLDRKDEEKKQYLFIYFLFIYYEIVHKVHNKNK